MKSGGRVTTIGSAVVGERVAAPGRSHAGTKGAVKMFTQALAREIGSRGITVTVQPGPIDTDLNPALVIGGAAEAASARSLRACG